MKKVTLFLCLVMVLTGCATGSGVKVVERSDDKPSWASITHPVTENGDKMRFVGYFTVDGDSRPSAVIHGSGTKAIAMPLESISDDFMEQSGVAEDVRESTAKLIITALRRNPPTIPGLQVVGNYYERVEIRNSDGSVKSEIRAYSLAECSVAEYNQAKHEALERLKGDPKIKKELDSVMAEQRDRAYKTAEAK